MKLSADSPTIVQGIGESLGQIHALLMRDYGTKVVAGIQGGRGGTDLAGIPIFDVVEHAVAGVGDIETTVIVSPAYEALDAVLEAISAGIAQIVVVTDGVPPLDAIQMIRKAEVTDTTLLGPNSPGVIVPGRLLWGTHPNAFYKPGSVGIVSSSTTLTYEAARCLTVAGIGQSIVVGIGSDTVVGSSVEQWLQALDEDEATEVILLVQEINGQDDTPVARYIAEEIDKPVVTFLAGQSVPSEYWSKNSRASVALPLGTGDRRKKPWENKIAILKEAGACIVKTPSQVPVEIAQLLKTTSPR